MRSWLCAFSLSIVWVSAWPGMRGPVPENHMDLPIGPTCTVEAHGASIGECPNMPQPPPPANSTPGTLHIWPDSFVVDWTMSFVNDMSDEPPYSTGPSAPFNITKGTTFYQVVDSQLRNMKEVYDEYCIPVFPTWSRNDFSCSFTNVGETHTSFVTFGPSRPSDVPECCIIGRPFHPPPPDFAHQMPLHYRDEAAGEAVDWNVVYDVDAGPFAYGFQALELPAAAPAFFYMIGIMGGAPLWMWQDFHNFQPGRTPPPDTWEVPASCQQAVACPGWEPDRR